MDTVGISPTLARRPTLAPTDAAACCAMNPPATNHRTPPLPTLPRTSLRLFPTRPPHQQYGQQRQHVDERRNSTIQQGQSTQNGACRQPCKLARVWTYPFTRFSPRCFPPPRVLCLCSRRQCRAAQSRAAESRAPVRVQLFRGRHAIGHRRRIGAARYAHVELTRCDRA